MSEAELITDTSDLVKTTDLVQITTTPLNHVYFEPSILSDFNIQLDNTVFHVHKFQMYKTCGYFKTLFDANPSEYDRSKEECKEIIPTLVLPDSFLSELSRLHSEMKQTRTDTLGCFLRCISNDSYKEIDAFQMHGTCVTMCHLATFFDCTSVRKQVVDRWISCVNSNMPSHAMGFVYRTAIQLHLDTIRDKVITSFKSRWILGLSGSSKLKDEENNNLKALLSELNESEAKSLILDLCSTFCK
jgi:hypothetical protein